MIFAQLFQFLHPFFGHVDPEKEAEAWHKQQTEIFESLGVDRAVEGHRESVFMVTHGVIGIIEPRKVYDIGAHGIVELDKKLAKKKNTKPTIKGVTVTRPPLLQLANHWGTELTDEE